MAFFPCKPDNEERDIYFYGFSGSPKLVARTGHNRWTKSLSESEYRYSAGLIHVVLLLPNPDVS
ncbi:hypothetical protein F4801DRAFT_566103 [Xylaria longipes]|nr:hypothetical protein F4801DRAFT_566103 [Xylaria longipes]